VDDVPSISPADSDWCEEFTDSYKQLCSDLNVVLAEDCPLNDKAFSCQTRGKVLGIMFDSSDMTWRVPEKKIEKCLRSIMHAQNAETCTLKEWQKLHGRLNDRSQICCFMKLFKQSVNECMIGIESNANPNTPIVISAEAKKDLAIWAGFLSCPRKWLPIGSAFSEPPIRCMEFVSDAAGLADTADFRSRPGAGNVGFSEDGRVIFANQYLWPETFIRFATDEENIRYGDKTTTLEVLGLLFPFVLVPDLLKNQHVKLKVDCFGTVFGMWNRRCKGDKSASIFIRAVYLIAAYLGCTVHVQQLPRVSDWGAEVTDRLSRLTSSTKQDLRLVKAFCNRPLPKCLLDWFMKPAVDWSLPMKLLEHVKNIV